MVSISLRKNLNRQLLVFLSLLKITKNLNADILDPRTGIARPLIGVSMAGQAPFDGNWLMVLAIGIL